MDDKNTVECPDCDAVMAIPPHVTRVVGPCPGCGTRLNVTPLAGRIARILESHEELDPSGCYTDWEAVAAVLVDELGLREISTTGRMDDQGFIHVGGGHPDGPTRYISYVSGWREA